MGVLGVKGDFELNSRYTEVDVDDPSRPSQETSDGSTANYYELPSGAKEIQHLISYKDMNAQMGEIFRAVYRYGQCSHSAKLRDAKKIKYYIEAEIERLEMYESDSSKR